ncbi:hypothetical protein AAG570_012396 [Ranatra chinensis]|uniref:Uncharacterized protein n=1 Tax=Ranatra chinensis TaxID=642074 RepID=A0ABD0Z721_9HEMI
MAIIRNRLGPTNSKQETTDHGWSSMGLSLASLRRRYVLFGLLLVFVPCTVFVLISSPAPERNSGWSGSVRLFPETGNTKLPIDTDFRSSGDWNDGTSVPPNDLKTPPKDEALWHRISSWLTPLLLTILDQPQGFSGKLEQTELPEAILHREFIIDTMPTVNPYRRPK